MKCNQCRKVIEDYLATVYLIRTDLVMTQREEPVSREILFRFCDDCEELFDFRKTIVHGKDDVTFLQADSLEQLERRTIECSQCKKGVHPGFSIWSIALMREEIVSPNGDPATLSREQLFDFCEHCEALFNYKQTTVFLKDGASSYTSADMLSKGLL